MRTPLYVQSYAGELGGCRSFFVEGEHGPNHVAFPLAQPTSPHGTGDDFHHQLDYLHAHFAGRKDLTAGRLARYLASGSVPVQLAAVDLLGCVQGPFDHRAWGILGPALVEVAGHRPDSIDENRWSDVVHALTWIFIRSVSARRSVGANAPAWWPGAEKVLLRRVEARLANGFVASGPIAALRKAGFDLRGTRPTWAQLAKVRARLGMPPRATPMPKKGLGP